MPLKKILLTNDDGYDSPGLRALCTALEEKYSVTVAAPMTEQSGKGHSFTYKQGISYEFDNSAESPVYRVSGTPSDAVKLALANLLDERPDCVISGINDGVNLGIASFYSGTVGAAREAVFWRIPAVAFSADYRSSGDFDRLAAEAVTILETMDEKGMLVPRGNHLYNVNFPYGRLDRRKLRFCRQSLAYYSDAYEEVHENGRRKLFVKGKMVEIEESLVYDIPAFEAGYTTVTPMSIDSTCDRTMEKIKDIQL
ncbi:MAG: 5'/3'-nucleotidase SurE [Fibrobacterota bacterium]